MGSKGRKYRLAQDRSKEGPLHAFTVADGGTRTHAVCGAHRYRSQNSGSIDHTDPDKPEDMCRWCRLLIEREPPVGHPRRREWLDSKETLILV